MTDLAAKSQGQLLRRHVIGAETSLQHEVAGIVERERADLRRRSFGGAGQDLLQDLVEVQRRRRGLQRLLQVAQLPDAALVLLVQLCVADGDDALVAQRGKHSLVARGPLSLLAVEDR